MSTIRRISAVTIIILSAVLCFAQFHPKKARTVCKNYPQPAAAASITEAEDFTLVNLLTLKFM